jgi:hypothetical protein
MAQGDRLDGPCCSALRDRRPLGVRWPRASGHPVRGGRSYARDSRAYLENCIAAVGVLYRQDTKGTRWMPWRQKPMKDVDGCDKPR